MSESAEERGRARGARDAGEKSGGLFHDLPTLLVAVAIALAIRTFLYQSFYVPSDSMFPTLLVGDHVFVNKFVYGPRLPFTDLTLPGLREPRRGEIAVFRLARSGPRIYPADRRPDLQTETFIKRLVGLPGDRVAVRGGQLYLNGEPVPLVPTGERFTDSTGRAFDVHVETLGECRHEILDDPRFPGIDMPEKVVEEGRYFFLGDNRDNSYDSRRWGTARLPEIEGPAGLLYWSWEWNGGWLELLNPLTWWRNLTQKTRWSRFGDFVGCLDPSS